MPALGMFVMGMEEGKRPVEITLTLANGEEHDGHESDMGGAEYFKGPLDVGGVGVVAYRVQSDDPTASSKKSLDSAFYCWGYGFHERYFFHR